MAHDIVIRGGTIVDGTGAEPFCADLGVKDGRIAEIGRIARNGAQEIDADGLTVSPGFIDLHTHLDAQIGWDPDLTPISWHGVTTALMGNCGVTFAPCKPQDRHFLAAMMQSVEDIPSQAIMSGLPWTWETYGDYLASVETLKPGINIAGLVGHSAVRYYVMGERSFTDDATDAEKAQMAQIVGRAIDAGAIGFSTNRFAPHKAPDGRSIPGTFADPSELVAIGAVVAARGGLMQAVGASGDVLKTIADETGARVLFSYAVGADRGAGQRAAEGLERLVNGRDVTAICQVKGTGFMFGLQCSLPFRGEAWDRLRGLDSAGRLAAIKDPATAVALAAEGETRIQLEHTYYIGDEETPNLTAPRDQNVQAMMAARGETFVELFLRVSRETEGRALFNFRLFCQDMDELGELFKGSAHVLPSLGDAGAHVSQIIDADWATFVLKYWIKERGAYTLAQGIQRMTSDPARVMGLKDRGALKVGLRADINVFDLDRVTQLQPHIVHNFPGGAPHFTQRARGYKATLVNGQVNVRDDESTGARAGMVLRHAHYEIGMPFAVNRGQHIHYTVEGDGPLVVLQHGLLSSAASWKAVGYVDALTDRYRVACVDSLGHGQSDKPADPALYHQRCRAGDIVAVMDALGAERAHLVGYSMGGWISVGMAKYHPDRLASLTIGGWDPVAGPASAAATLQGREMTLDAVLAAARAMAPALTAWVTPEVEPGLRGCWDALSEVAGAGDAIAALSAPVMLWAGLEDPVHDPMRDLAETLGRRFLSTPGDHFAARMVHTADVIAGLREFIEGR